MAAMALLALLGLVAGSARAAAAKKQPNFVYVLCDDMNELLGDEAIVKQWQDFEGALSNDVLALEDDQ